MKKNLLFIFILALFAATPLLGEETWDILDKSMAAYTENGGATNNQAWDVNKGTSVPAPATQQEGYVNFTKTRQATTSNYAWLRSKALGDLTLGTAYTIEVKARVNPIGVADDANNFEANQISLRLGQNGKNTTASIFLKYGDGVTGGSVATKADGSNAYKLNTSEWQVYRLIFQADHSKYDVYVYTGGVIVPLFANVAKGTTTDQNGVYFGAESKHHCNIDVEYVKMGTGDFMIQHNANLASLGVSAGTLIPDFDPSITEYVCEYLAGTATITPSATAVSETAQIAGTETVDVSSGSATSTVVVTAEDGVTTKSYTINYVHTYNVNCTHLIVNNDFDYAAEGIAWNASDDPGYPKFPDGSSAYINNSFRPLKQNLTKIDSHLEFYGWQLSNWEFLFKKVDGTFINSDEGNPNYGTSPNQSIGIGSATTFHNGTALWIAGHKDAVMPEDFEFYQIIDKDALEAGTYKVTCQLGVQNGYHTSQRIFANQNVQFYGIEADYVTNKTVGEIYSYAGNTPTSSENTDKAMKVYVTISDADSLKIGIRSGKKTGNGTTTGGSNLAGWFKVDYFRLTKLAPDTAANASLSAITLSAGAIDDFSPETFTYSVTLPEGTTTVTPAATGYVQDVTVTGTEAVDVSSGSGTSTIVVTALDGSTTATYTINYTVSTASGLNAAAANTVSYAVDNGLLTVKGADAYTVYSINGLIAAEVKDNTAGKSVRLIPGVYVVKTNAGAALKVVIN
jgi:hypothetical protein